MLIFILFDAQYSQKAVFIFEKGSNCQNQSSSGSLHPVKKFRIVKFTIPPQSLTAIWKIPIYKTSWPLFADGVHLLQGYTEPLWGDSLLFTRYSWYSLNQSPKDERLRWPWSHPVVLNLCINLVIIKYKVTICQTDSVMTLNSELFQSEFSVLSGRLIKNMFPLHICRPNDYTIEISVLLQIQFYNIFTNVPSIIFKSCH